MISVIIAGGSGTRLWPLSTNENPKQLLKLVNDYTMVQNTYNRATTFSKEIYVVPDSTMAGALRDQLPVLDDRHCIVEPGRRGTANCIVAALVQIAKDHDHDEPVAFMSTDHQIRDTEGLARSFKRAGEVSSHENEIALIGIEPTYPATGFGYIERDGEVKGFPGVYQVQSFKEKPDFDTAKQYMRSGRYLWNCGYFVGSVNTFVQEMKRSAPDLYKAFQELSKIGDPLTDEYRSTYLALESNSIDYGLIEKAKSLSVVPAAFDWMDVGNFKDLHDVNEHDENGNHFAGENIHDIEVENAYVRNEEPEKPIAIIGLDNVVVVNTKDGILVSRKDVSSRVGEIAKKVQA